jgi:uncharacterized iron-regulated membrane protein
MPGWNPRRLLLNLHLWLGLAAGAVLVCTALSGSILAFQPDLDRWLHPSLHRASGASTRSSERELLARATGAAGGSGAPAIERVELGGSNESQVVSMRSGARVYIDPHTGAILGIRSGETPLERVLGGIFQFHVRLLAGNAGQWVVDVATALLLLLVPSGVILWWNRKRLAIRRGANARQVTWDLHSVAGIYGSAFVTALAVSGLLLAWEQPLYWLARAKPEREPAVPHSVVPVAVDAASAAGDPDAWLGAAARALPGQRPEQVLMPLTTRSAAQVVLRGPGGLGHSTVFVDRYDAHVLRVDEFARGPRAVRAHVLDRAVHTGAIGGFAARVVLALASLAVAVLAVTGTILWWKRVAG